MAFGIMVYQEDVYTYGLRKHVTDETLYSVYGTWIHRILVYDSMSTIGIWVLRATPPWREPPPETLIPRY